jgi:hypothetical protein
MEHLSAGNRAVVYLQDKLGGEITLPATERSPELALDVTMVEVVRREGAYMLGRYGILEVQTMDFHGTYRHAVEKMEAAQTLYPTTYPGELEKNPHWLSDRVEGPNIANVFKRTFYQMALKFQIGSKEPCGGCVLAIPTSVWDSWQRHLARPVLAPLPDGTFKLDHPERPSASGQRTSTWILVFDIAATTQESPGEFVISKAIATDAAALAYYALEAAPQAAVADGAASTILLASLHRRLKQWWPELLPSACP